MKTQMNFRPVAAIILVVALSIFGIDTGHPAHASTTGNPIVTVGNTTANPVPTAAQGTTAISGSVAITGTPNVNVSNVPAVQAQQSGPWTVGVNGTPSVNVASLPAVTLSGTPTVNIANGSINATRAAASNFAVLFEPGLAAQTSKSYYFGSPGPPTTVDATAILGHTDNDIDVVFVLLCGNGDRNCAAPNTPPLHFSAGNIILTFNQPLRITALGVSNPALLTSATFQLTFAGD